MGIAIPQVITSDRASGAQVINGSLNFDQGKKQYLNRTFSAGNRRTWTFSAWVKKSSFGTAKRGLFGHDSTNDHIRLQNNDDGGDSIRILAPTVFDYILSRKDRDTGWFHLVVSCDTTDATAGDRVKIYHNGVRQTSFYSSSNPSQNAETGFNQAAAHSLGRGATGSDTSYVDGSISNVYWIDGQALGPEYFGFTDPLTNTWKPKKYTGTFGTNGFWLPMDGNLPVGQDQSGQGNDWTPVNFGGSVALDNPIVSGARPILNTTQGGTQAGVGVFGSRENIGYAVTVHNSGGGNKFYLDGVEAPTLSNLIRGVTYTFDQSDSSNSTHPLVFGSTAEGNNFARGALYGSISAGSAGAATTITIPYDAPETLYYHCSAHSGMGSSIVGIRTDETKADQYASNCTLALPLVGSDGDVCASIACTANNKTPTNSNVSASSTESNFYNGSHYWSSASDTLEYAEQGDELVFGTGDYTIECWVYDDNGHNGGGSGRCYIFDNRIGGSETGDPPTLTGWVDSHNEFSFYDGDSEITHTVSSTIGKWWHYAVTREGTTTRMFIDGIEVGSSTNSTDFTNNGIGVGRATDGGYGWAGYIQDFRVYRGLAKYTSDFVVPATSPDVLPDTPSGVSGGSKLTKITEGAVSFDGSNDCMETTTSADYQFGTGDFTVECFVYLKKDNANQIMVGNWGSSDGWQLYFTNTGDKFAWYSDSTLLISSNTVIKKDRWYHVAAARTGSTTKLFVDGILEGSASDSTDYNQSKPLEIGRQQSTDTNHLEGFISNIRIVKGTALYTKSFTPPTRELTNVTNTKLLCCQSNTLTGSAAVSPNISGINDGTVWSSTVTGPTRVQDRVANAFKGSSGSPGAIPAYPGTLRFEPGFTGISTLAVRGWYAGSGVSLHINGVAQSPSGGAYDIGITTTRLDSIVWTAVDGFNYYRIDQIEIDGVALVDPVVGTDDSKEAATNFNPFITDIHAVRGQETGYPTMNPLAKNSAITLEDGNLRIKQTDSHGQKKIVYSTAQIPNDGKWYVEWHLGGPACTLGFGMNGKVEFRGSDTQIGTDNNSWGYEPNGNLFHNGNLGGSYGASSAGDVIGMTIDTSGSTITAQWYENGVLIRNSSGDAAEFTGIARSDYIVMMSQHTPNYDTVVNFGQKPFKFPPPEGYQSLNAANTRPVNVISRPDQYVGVMTYSGISTSGNVVNDLNFNSKPDFVWIKANSGSDSPSTQNHYLVDSVRGANGSVTKKLYSNSNGEENSGQTDANNGVNFIHNGFELTSDNDGTNANNGYVAWCWKAGGDKNTFNIDNVGYSTAGAAGLDGGSITPSGASVGTKQGFSIIKYTGTGTAGTISHGLSEQPKFVIIKDLKNANSWAVQHVGTVLGTGLLKLDVTNSVDTSVASAVWNSTAPTSSVFSVGTSGDVNYTTNDAEYIAYLWHDVPGLQKFGVFKGNGNANGIFVELGFKPAILLIKNSNNTGDWIIWDSERNPHNPVNRQIWPYTTSGTYGAYDQVASNYPLDFLSNGFKMRTTDADMNDGSRSYIYCAWAEAPSVNLYGGGANAR